jgi:hypothetical protein
MPVTIHLDSEASRYISAFSIAAIVAQDGRIIAYHRPADLPRTAALLVEGGGEHEPSHSSGR